MAKQKSLRKVGRLAFEANILDGLADPVILIDERRHVVDCNLAANELLGPDAKDRDLSASLASPQVVKAVDAALAGEPTKKEEVFLPMPVSRTYELSVWEMPPRTPGKAVWAMLVLHDVTATKKAERMRADFVSNVSHELRSPLSSLLGFIETLRGPARDDRDAQRRFLTIMEAEAMRMTRLINDLLTLSKVETDEHIRPEGKVDMEKLLAQVAESLSLRADGRRMPIELDAPPNLPAVVGDGDELNQVFQNLLDNALIYGNEGTPVRIVMREVDPILDGDGAGLSIAVENQGEGIASEHLPRLTERFYRIDKGRSRSVGGTGLGLAVVKHIVSRHRGHLTIASTPGKTTTFTVCLPAAAQDGS